MDNKTDINENYIYKLDNGLLKTLLIDRSSGKNIIWATDNYSPLGLGYRFNDKITAFRITGRHGNIIKPRVEKSKKEQSTRIRDKAEVFTPSWICNKQNNLVDNAWFGSENIFNTEVDKSWIAKTEKIIFPTNTQKTWQEYIEDIRLEITCGEAPYLVSRYDTVTGDTIEIKNRVGLLDRKLRILNENVNEEKEWINWTARAFKSIYGYDWQGDNILLARENLLLTFVDYYEEKFRKFPPAEYLKEIAEILSWNIWQMDGLKYVIPESCKKTEEIQQALFNTEIIKHPCEGCAKNDPLLHNGIYCKIKDWKTNKKIKFVSLT